MGRFSHLRRRRDFLARQHAAWRCRMYLCHSERQSGGHRSPLRDLARHWCGRPAAAVKLIRDTFGKYVVIPALKACTGHFSGDAQWDIVRPPLMPMDAEDKDTLVSDLYNLGFGMPGLMTTAEPTA